VSRSFAYDKIDEVKSVSGSNTESYTYDKNGNRTNAGYKHIDQNRLTTDGVYSYDYDLEGNRTKRTEIATGKVDEYTWDYRNRLTSVVSRDVYGVVTQTVSYEYDVNDLRVSKNVDGSVEKYFLDGDNIAFVTDGAGKQTFHYLYGMEADQVLAQDSETGMVWSLADRLGSIDVLVNEQGVIVDQRTYDSFGNTLSQLDPSVKFRFGYTGRESDPETGLYYYRARYFDANVGRFISTDPIGFEAGDSNLYRYVGNRSTLATDPTGEFAFLPILGIIALGGLIAGAADVVHQGLEIAEGSRRLDQFSLSEVGTSVIFGALATPIILALPQVGLALGAVGAATASYNITHGKPLSGAFDLVTSLLPFTKMPPGSSGLQFAMAGGGRSSSGAATINPAVLAGLNGGLLAGANAPGLVSGIGAIGHGVQDLYRHYLASDTGKDGNSNGSTPENNFPSSTPENIPDLTGKPRSIVEKLLIDKGFEARKTTPGGYQGWKHPDKSEIWIGPDLEVDRFLPKEKSTLTGKMYQPRIDQNGNRIVQDSTKSRHHTGEIISEN
jgi:RHS repeat-associated protein